ncbi:MAG: ATP-binding protein [Victivallaceae bacterium]|nr:ATP-binding protein [Victivallaceae bacterium]
MKKRDAILFAMPVGAAVFLAVFAAFLYWQIARFEDSYTEETRTTIAQEANLVSAVIRPMLDSGNTAEAINFCSSFDRDSLRVSLIDASGRVVADSGALPGLLGNHLSREEVHQALAGTPASAVRYSESLGKWMMYYAVPVKTATGNYVLRAAVSTDRVSKLINFARLNMIFALLLGGDIVLVLAFYIAKRVRKPLAALLQSVDDIAEGKLDSRIEIPEGGLVRDLAVRVSEMTEQLKHRLAETQLERNEKDALLETMSEGVLLFAPDGALLRHNAAASQLFDFARGDRFDLSRCRIPELLTLAHRTLQSGEPFEKEFTLVRSGVTHSLFVKGRVLNSRGDRRLLLTVTELTNLHKLESFRSDFVANVSHEIKTPLTGIIGAAEALEEDDESLPPEQRRKMLEILKVQSGRLNNLVHDILSLAELEKQQLATARNFEPTELDAVIENAVNLCAQNAAAAGITLEVRNSLPLAVNADCQLLEQAVVNLIENAIKYSGSKRIDVSVKQADGRAVIEVEDYGIGIAQEHQKRIFERFYRVDKSRSREMGGTGLGLAIVKHIAQLHHGTAGVESDPGEGSTFRIELPL